MRGGRKWCKFGLIGGWRFFSSCRRLVNASVYFVVVNLYFIYEFIFQVFMVN